MSIENVISRHLTATAVYWGNPTPGGTGKYTFDDAVEINCMWVMKKELLIADNGQQSLSRAQVIVGQDLDEGGFLYLGELDDLDSSHDDPVQIDGAFKIKVFEKIPDLTVGGYFRRAML